MLVSRDPFARQETHRKLVYRCGRTCDWCGGLRTVNGKPSDKLWKYSTEPDGLWKRSYDLQGVFCSASCFHSYQN